MFQLRLPEKWQSASTINLVLKNVEIPQNRGVILRVYAGSDPQSIGSVSFLGTSPQATGTRHLDRVEINLTLGFRRWATTARPGSTVKIQVKPFAGLKEDSDYRWQVNEADIELR